MIAPSLAAFIAALAIRHHQSRRKIREFLVTWFGVPLSVGSIDRCIREVGVACESIVEDLLDEVRAAGIIHADETPWHQGILNRWLWVVLTATTAVFHIGSRRHEEIRDLLGDAIVGWLVTDGYGAYRDYERRQRCLAHLIRKALALAGGLSPDGAQFGEWLVRELRALIHAVAEDQGHTILNPIQARLILEEGVVTVSEKGTGQGSVASPLLANVYLHYVLDLWAERWRRHEAIAAAIALRFGQIFLGAGPVRPRQSLIEAVNDLDCGRGRRRSRWGRRRGHQIKLRRLDEDGRHMPCRFRSEQDSGDRDPMADGIAGEGGVEVSGDLHLGDVSGRDRGLVVDRLVCQANRVGQNHDERPHLLAVGVLMALDRQQALKPDGRRMHRGKAAG